VTNAPFMLVPERERPPAFSVHLIGNGSYRFTVPAVSATFDWNVTQA